ncbi:MAG TPA: rhomboid family intramembrane serine protease [Vulgatibacter sp.]
MRQDRGPTAARPPPARLHDESATLSLPSTITIRGPAGEEILDLEEFEDRMKSGEIDPHTEILFPPLTGTRWVRAADLDAFRGRYEPKALYFSRAFRLGRVPLLTFALSLANLVVFMLARRHGPIDTGTLLDFGAKAGPLLHDLGETWRLLSANFVHRDWAHIGFNLFVLFHFGAAVENAYRPLDYLIIVFASALGTTTLSYAMTDAISAGASGVGYGMLGSAVVFGVKYRKILPARYRSVLGGAVLPTLLIFLYLGWISSGVDNWGHVGGLAAGSAATFAFRPRLLGDPPARRAMLLERVAPLVAVLLALLFGGKAIAGWLPRMATVRSDRLGLEVELPAHWHQRDALAFDNGMSQPGRASFTAGVLLLGEPPDLERAAADFVRGELRPQVESGVARNLVLGPLRYVHVAGLLGVAQEASFVVEETEVAVTAYLFARGALLYDVVLARPRRLEGYDRIFERIVGSVRLDDPDFLTSARRRVEEDPGGLAARLALADAERQLGQLERARATLAIAAVFAPGSGEVLARQASLAFLEGLGRRGCALAARAQQAAPSETLTLVALAECARSTGDPAAADAWLRKAHGNRTTDPVLRDRVERMMGRGP